MDIQQVVPQTVDRLLLLTWTIGMTYPAPQEAEQRSGGGLEGAWQACCARMRSRSSRGSGAATTWARRCRSCRTSRTRSRTGLSASRAVPVDGRDGPPDVCVIELGGTVGDIESMPFIEALRQVRLMLPFGWLQIALTLHDGAAEQQLQAVLVVAHMLVRMVEMNFLDEEAVSREPFKAGRPKPAVGAVVRGEQAADTYHRWLAPTVGCSGARAVPVPGGPRQLLLRAREPGARAGRGWASRRPSPRSTAWPSCAPWASTRTSSPAAPRTRSPPPSATSWCGGRPCRLHCCLLSAHGIWRQACGCGAAGWPQLGPVGVLFQANSAQSTSLVRAGHAISLNLVELHHRSLPAMDAAWAEKQLHARRRCSARSRAGTWLNMFDVSNIWHVPIVLEAQGAHQSICTILGLGGYATMNLSGEPA